MRLVSLKYLLLATFAFGLLAASGSESSDAEVVVFESRKRGRQSDSRDSVSVSSATAAPAVKRGRKLKAASNDSVEAAPTPKKRAKKNSAGTFTSGSAAEATVDYEAIGKELMDSLDNPKSVLSFNAKISALKAESVPQKLSHDLIIKSIAKGRESNTKTLLEMGFRLWFGVGSVSVEDSTLMEHAFNAGKFNFLPILLDTDPGATVTLLNNHLAMYPSSTIPGHLTTVLLKNGTDVDPEAVQIAAEHAARLRAVAIFEALLDSEMLTRPIPVAYLVEMFAFPNKPSITQNQANGLVLNRIIRDRKLTAPFDLSMLSHAALKNDLDFIYTIEPHLYLFSWNVVIQALEIALSHKFYNFADVLLSTNTYSVSDFAFRIVSEDKFLDTVAAHANTEIINKVVNMVYHDGSTMLVSDLGLVKIYKRAVEVGNIEVVDFFLNNSFFDLNMRFNKKSIFRIALEHKQINLVNYLIKFYGFRVYDSDTEIINPALAGGDFLIYIARNENATTFEYLLKLGANPNARVLHDGKLISLLQWCIMKEQHVLVKLLLENNCDFDGRAASSWNIKGNKDIESLIAKAVVERSD